MPIKVAHIVRQYSPSVGGMEEVVHSIAQSQLQHGYLPRIITLNRLFTDPHARLKEDDVVSGIPVKRLPYYGSCRYPICLNVLKHVADVDIIHVHGIDFFFDYLALTRAIHGRPMVVSTHGGFFHTKFLALFKTAYFKTITRLSSLAYSKVIATCNNDGEVFCPIVSSEKLIVIENGVNVDKFKNMSSASLAQTLIYFGRWSENKRLSEVIRFFRVLLTREAGWRLIIAGREYDGSQKELTELIKKYDLTQSVQLVINPASEDLASLIGQASYFISLSGYEGFGIAPIEGMSAGLTPVLSDLPPFRSLIERSGLGVLVYPDDMEQGVSSLLSLHQQGDEKYKDSRLAVRSFVQQYDWHRVAARYRDVYADLLG